jgi:membrane fusion protein
VSELFRREAIEHATRKLDGTVVLATPLSLKVLCLVLASLVSSALVFASLASYSRKASVAGYLVPDKGMIRATSRNSGTLEKLLRKEGEQVAAGDRIAVVTHQTETTTGRLGDALSKGLELEAQSARQKTLSRIAQLRLERRQAKVRLSKSKSELSQVQVQIKLQSERLALLKEEVGVSVKLAAKGLLSRRETSRRRLTLLAAEKELAEYRRQQAAIERANAEIQTRLASIPLEIDVANSEAKSVEAKITQRRVESEARRVQYVVAPLSGRIAALPVTNGQALSAGTTVAIIIPTNGTIEALLLAPSRSIGFVRPGQTVAMRLEAFPYQRFGTIAGTIHSVSSTVIAPSEVGLKGLDIREPVFRVRVTLSQKGIRAYGKVVPFQPGMLVSSDVIFDRRSLLEWLFDPIYAVARRA